MTKKPEEFYNMLLNEKYEIRRMTLADAGPCLSIEKDSETDPWHLHDFTDNVDKEHSVWLVCCGKEDPADIVGFICFQVLFECSDLLDIAVSPAHRRQGIAKALWLRGLFLLKERHVEKVMLEVRASNISAISLYASLGFKKISTRRAYYRDPLEDAIIMMLEI
ncbi:MAG: ribosomal protein S18-alanine N-acetyltransferase [Lachnospiraceae bacterium]|nr:ribosomal protein S18-alanine N-acetyltransferase [Lachnospiraceae bacterium]MEE3460839.1 ribosomal protein S18-alanine N-acetyltransferase [Lachnospiraceae bacterium]